MFTGLVQDIGEVIDIKKDGDWRITIKTGLDLSLSPSGASIMCDGVCLTVIEKNDDFFKVDVSSETVSKTNIEAWIPGTRINLEPSLKMGDELGGHFVFGHVDGQATVLDIKQEQDSHIIRFAVPDTYGTYIATKGSISLSGVSLTVNDVNERGIFSVNIIPHTWQQTTLQYLKVDDTVNFEVDMLARYVQRMLSMQTTKGIAA